MQKICNNTILSRFYSTLNRLNTDRSSRGFSTYFGILLQTSYKVGNSYKAYFVYVDEKSNKITSYMTYEGNSLHKEFNMFINKTLAAQKDLNKPTTVYVPEKYLNKKSIDIWGSHASYARFMYIYICLYIYIKLLKL